MINYAPLRYPGGKGKFAPYVSKILELNGIVGGHYVEPFAGGAAVALWLLFNEYSKFVHINDLDKNVHSFWHSIISDTDKFCKLVRDTPVTIDVWLKQRHIKNNPDDHSKLEVGFATFFLNRTNHSGILNAGVIGGQDQTGNWKIDARYNKDELIERIQRIGDYSSRIKLHNLDACDFIKDIVVKLPADTLVYLDPPYYVKGGWLYQNHYQHDDHSGLAKTVSKIKKQKWIMSYDNDVNIKQLYKAYRQEVFSLNYTVRAFAKGSEVMIFQDGLQRPANVTTTLQKRSS